MGVARVGDHERSVPASLCVTVRRRGADAAGGKGRSSRRTACRRCACFCAGRDPAIHYPRPGVWQPVAFAYDWSMSGYENHIHEGERWHFFVRRRELDQCYPVAVSAEQTEPQQPAKLRHTPPGPSPRHDWAEHAAFEAGRIVERDNKWPSAPHMCEWCMNKWNWQPDESDMRKLLKRLRG